MTAQAELLERELDMERIELRRSPEMETAELAAIYMARGVDRKTAEEMRASSYRDEGKLFPQLVASSGSECM